MSFRPSGHGALTRLLNFKTRDSGVWRQDAEYKHALRGFPLQDRKAFDQEKRYTLYNLAKSIADVPGDLAECGVYRGHSGFLMLAANSQTKKKLHGFDSFKGLALPSESNMGYEKENNLSVSLSLPYLNIWYQFPNRVALHAGWIPEQFGEAADTTFSMIHIDVALYEPVRQSLDFLWPRLNEGGILVCDAYGSSADTKRAVDEFARRIEKPVSVLPTGQASLTK